MTGKDIEPFIRLFAPHARADLRAELRTDTFATYATRLAPGARLASATPRVKGRITYRAARDADGIRVLRITTNFVWVYPFEVADPAPGAGLVVVHHEVVWEVPHVADVAPSGKGLWLIESQSYASNIDCAPFEKGLLAPPSLSSVGGPPDTEDPDSMFDPDRSLEITSTC